jgi:tetratricopeptide (TPR) repeat protein
MVPGRFSNLEFDDEARGRERETKPARGQRRLETDLLDRAHEEHRNSQFESALRLFTRALQQDRKLVPAWVGQVQMLVALGEYHEARVWSDKALELFRNNGELLAAKAQACIRLNDLPTAYRCSDGALQMPGSSPWRWEVRGELLLADRKKQYETCFQTALAEPAADWFDRVVIARILVFHHRVAAAVAYLQQALELEPTRAGTWLELGECQAALGLRAAACTSYDRCLELRPDDVVLRRRRESLDAVSPWAWLRGLWRRRRR